MTVRYLLAGLTGFAVAGVVGVLAWILSPVAPEVSGVVFAATALPFGWLLGWSVAVAPKTLPQAPHSADSVESTWLNGALAGTATDLVLVTGLALTAVSITRAELPTQLVLLGVLLVAGASTLTRYALARKRGVHA